MFQALGVPDRYPAVPSVSRLLVSQCVRAPLVELLGCAAIAYSVRVSGGGTDSFHGLEYFGLFTCAFLASSVSHGVATPPLLPALTVYYREVPLLVFRLLWYLVRCFL